MDDDNPKPEHRYRVSTAKMSKTPSWIMLGFLLGAAFVAALPPLRKKPAPEGVTLRAVEPPRPAEPREPPQLLTIEAVFSDWGKHAVWSDDTTEVALWNARDRAFTDFYEVRRLGESLFFRTIPRLTRRIIARGKHLSESPLQFTETEEQYREWRNYDRVEQPIDRGTATPPRNFTVPSSSAPVERTLRVTPPAIPAPEFPASGREAKE